MVYSATTTNPITTTLSTAMDEEVAPIPACNAIDEFNRLVGKFLNQPEQILSMPPQPQPLTLNALPNSLPAAIHDKIWEWNSLPEAGRDYNASDFK